MYLFMKSIIKANIFPKKTAKSGITKLKKSMIIPPIKTAVEIGIITKFANKKSSGN